MTIHSRSDSTSHKPQPTCIVVPADPLLENGLESDEIPPELTEPRRLRVTPLPKKQLFVLCTMRLSEPICFNLIFPFVNEMINHIGITDDPKETGFYSGVVEGLFAFAQFCTVLFWGRLSDRIGRRPVMLFGLSGVSVSILLFGLSRTFFQMVLYRSLAGILNGNAAVLKSAIAEITDETNQALAFGFIPLVWASGSVLASVIGGFLSRPSERFPNLFGGWQLFIDYPYFLPCLTGALTTVVAFFTGLFFMEETLKTSRPSSNLLAVKKWLPSYGTFPSSSNDATQEDDSSTASDVSLVKTLEGPPSISSILGDPMIRSILWAYTFLAFYTIMLDAVSVLWLYSPIEAGGVHFTAAEIGTTLAAGGIVSMIVNVFVFPPVQRRLGTLPVYRTVMWAYATITPMFPIVHEFAKRGDRAGVIIGVAIMRIVQSAASVAFACNMILVSAAAPTRSSLGTVNGVAQMVSSAMRGFGPVISSTVFALSMSKNYMHGQMVWIFLFAVGVAGALVTGRVKVRKPNIERGE